MRFICVVSVVTNLCESSSILGTRIPSVVASERKICVARWLDEIRLTLLMSSSRAARLAIACSGGCEMFRNGERRLGSSLHA